MAQVRENFTLSALNGDGNVCMRDLLAGVSTDIQMMLTFFRWKVVSGGPVACGSVDMAAVADGDVRDVEQGFSEDADGDRIDATQTYFRPTALTDVIFIHARSG